MHLKELIFGKRKQAEAGGAIYPDSLEAWLPVADVRDGIIVTRDGGYVKLLEVFPVNFRLQNDAQQSRMIGYFASYLKIAPDCLQILCLSQKHDITQYEQRMRAFMDKETSDACRTLTENRIQEVKYLAATSASIKRFFLVFRLEPSMRLRADTFEAVAQALYDEECTARSYLARCGLEVRVPDYADNFVCGTLFGILNKRSGRRVTLPLYFRTMTKTVHGLTEENHEETC